jgi:hypothetical protein
MNYKFFVAQWIVLLQELFYCNTDGLIAAEWLSLQNALLPSGWLCKDTIFS